jgi:two-component system sensor histidine kinase/response regulator
MKKILIVDDDLGYMEVTALKFYTLQNFEKKKYILLKAKDGFSGLQIAEKELPDLIISHLNMLGFNGFDMMNSLRENSLTKFIPCIMLINQDNEQNEEKAKELKIAAYLKKPFETNQLMKIVNNIFYGTILR